MSVFRRVNGQTGNWFGKAIIILGTLVFAIGLMTIRATGPEPLFLDGTVLAALSWWAAPVIMAAGIGVMAAGGLLLVPPESNTAD